MAELFDAEGRPVDAFIELVESSGPVSPRYQYATHGVVRAQADGIRLDWDHRDASGVSSRTGTLSPEVYAALWRSILDALPLGTQLDLTAGLRDRKGISFNWVSLALGSEQSRLDYVISNLEEGSGDARAIAVVRAIKSAVGTRGPGG
jgi:hypothetical protein